MTLALEIKREKKLSREEGKLEGKVEAIKSLMNNMKVSAEEAMGLLGIEKKDFSKYIAML